MEICFNNRSSLANNFLMNLPYSPTLKCQGSPTLQKKYLSNIKYNLLNKHVEYSDMHMGAEHPILGNKDVDCLGMSDALDLDSLEN